MILSFKEYTRILPLTLLATSCLLLCSCSLFEKDEDEEEAKASLKFEFQHMVNSQPLEFNTIKYTSAAGNQYSVTKLEYYVSSFYFTGMGDMAGDTVQKADKVFYVDGEKAATMEHTVEEVGEHHLHMGNFTFGLLPERNVTGALEDNPENAGMAWPDMMGGGYHFLKLEGKFMDGGVEKGYKIHLGNLVDSSGAHPVDFQVESLLLHAQPVAGYTLVIPIIMNIENWFKNPEVFDLSSTPMTMTNADAQALLVNNGKQDVFEAGEVYVEE